MTVEHIPYFSFKLYPLQNIANDKNIQNIDRKNKQSEVDYKNEQSKVKVKINISLMFIIDQH